jgi:hypothetical protein
MPFRLFDPRLRNSETIMKTSKLSHFELLQPLVFSSVPDPLVLIAFFRIINPTPINSVWGKGLALSFPSLSLQWWHLLFDWFLPSLTVCWFISLDDCWTEFPHRKTISLVTVQNGATHSMSVPNEDPLSHGKTIVALSPSLLPLTLSFPLQLSIGVNAFHRQLLHKPLLDFVL